MALTTLLGGELESTSGGGVEVKSLEGEGNVLGLYFSAHWCPPCRTFTPQLATWYSNFKKTQNGDKFEIVFVSSDRDEKTFKEYFGEMPWLALPYDKREKKAELSKKFKVQGIPTLVLLDGKTGMLKTADGRSVVMEDPEGKEFPWDPKTFDEIIHGEVINKADETKQWKDIAEDVIGLYFSAHWCGPCRAFTPQLIKTYNNLRADGKSFEIVFVSSDRDEEAMKEYLSDMPWWSIPFGDSRKKSLSRLFDISGIPTFVLMQRDGKVITTKGRAAMSQDPDGKEFPWYPKSVNSLTGNTAGEINDTPSLIWFTKETKEKAEAILIPIAKGHSEDSKELAFFYSREEEDDDEIATSLRTFAALPAAGDEKNLLVLLNIPNQQVYVHKGDVTAEVIKEVLSDYINDKLEWRKLRGESS